MSNSRRWEEFITWWNDLNIYYSACNQETFDIILRINNKINEIKKGFDSEH